MKETFLINKRRRTLDKNSYSISSNLNSICANINVDEKIVVVRTRIYNWKETKLFPFCHFSCNANYLCRQFLKANLMFYTLVQIRISVEY